MICGMKASKDTIETLVRSVAETNRELYCSMREDVSIFERRREGLPELLRLAVELRMDVKFIMVDLQTCLRACLITGKSYEK